MIANALLRDETFLAFCNRWHEDGRCPLPFADWLREHGLDGQADAAAWAAVEPDRPTLLSSSEPSIWGGIYPFNTDKYWAWGREHVGRCNLPDAVFFALPTRYGDNAPMGTPNFRGGPTFAEAIAAFLDAWAVVRGPSLASLEA